VVPLRGPACRNAGGGPTVAVIRGLFEAMAPAALKRTSRKTPSEGKDTPFPGFVQPCLPSLIPTVPSGSEWVHEIKYDGYRTQAHLRHGVPALYTRRGYDWTGRFRTLAEALPQLRANSLIMDGEAAVIDEQGIPDFEALYADLAGNRSSRVIRP